MVGYYWRVVEWGGLMLSVCPILPTFKIVQEADIGIGALAVTSER